MTLDFAIIGAGAAGFFAALAAKQTFPSARVALFEKTAALLSKVRVSGGGRCNVTHACFDPKALCAFYPRGAKELLGPFHRFGPLETIAWFAERGIQLKTEADGRMFPVTDSSQTIIDCLLGEARRLGVTIRSECRMETVVPGGAGFRLVLKGGERIEAQSLLIATGGSKEGHALAASLGHTIVPPAPSLFTFNVPEFPLRDLSGVAVPSAGLSFEGGRFRQQGALLITHFGFSGPAALKLSAFAARFLHERQYRCPLKVNWAFPLNEESLFQQLLACKAAAGCKSLAVAPWTPLPKSLWKRLCELAGLDTACRWQDVSHARLRKLAVQLSSDIYRVEGKTTHKEEFVTCGGIALSEVDFKTMQSRLLPRLFFAGEILDIDGVTGGFNFQNAWTGGFLAGSSCLA